MGCRGGQRYETNREGGNGIRKESEDVVKERRVGEGDERGYGEERVKGKRKGEGRWKLIGLGEWAKGEGEEAKGDRVRRGGKEEREMETDRVTEGGRWREKGDRS